MGLYRRRGVDSIGSPIFHNYSAGAALVNPAPAPTTGATSTVNPALVQSQAEQPFFTPSTPLPPTARPPQPKPGPRLVPPPSSSPNPIPLQPDPGGGHAAMTTATTTEGEFYPQGPGGVAGAFLQTQLGKTLLVGSIVAATVGLIYWLKTRHK